MFFFVVFEFVFLWIKIDCLSGRSVVRVIATERCFKYIWSNVKKVIIWIERSLRSKINFEFEMEKGRGTVHDSLTEHSKTLINP